MFSVSTENVCSRMCGNQNYREFGTAFTERVYPTTTCGCGCTSCSITEHLIINIFRENLFWFKASRSTLLGSHCDGRDVRQLIDHNASVVWKHRATNAAIRLLRTSLFCKEPEPIAWYCPNSELVFPPQSTLSEMPPQMIAPRALSLS